MRDNIQRQLKRVQQLRERSDGDSAEIPTRSPLLSRQNFSNTVSFERLEASLQVEDKQREISTVQKRSTTPLRNITSAAGYEKSSYLQEDHKETFSKQNKGVLQRDSNNERNPNGTHNDSTRLADRGIHQRHSSNHEYKRDSSADQRKEDWSYISKEGEVEEKYGKYQANRPEEHQRKAAAGHVRNFSNNEASASAVNFSKQINTQQELSNKITKSEIYF